ncbi:MAG TPA: efflux RND transporter permease subunit [Candidatus Cloacimonadota bacterium]|nr:efflux RND transporter permease subunit [Candidatus Cloacimonadota bacterium]HPS39809.1 efflux RND transporter permease subunit [Candidatus Cloacimonadota bacterium]
MFLSKISIRRPVMVTMAILVFVVFGILGYMGMPLTMMPDIQIPYVMVQTIYPGAGPREVESQISKQVEDAVAMVSQIDFIQSYSMDNVSVVLIKFKLSKDVDIANQEVKDKVDGISYNLPKDSQKPKITKMDVNSFPFMDIVLAGDMDGKALYELADKKLKDRFAQIEGVAQVSMTGGNKREVSVKLKDSVVYENKISLAMLNQILAAQNLDMPGGNFKKGSQEYFVRLKGEYQSTDDIANAKIPTAFGAKRLSSIAEVSDGSAEVRQRAIYFNVPDQKLEQNIIRISLTNSTDGNIVKIAKEARRQLPLIQKELPKGVTLRMIRDDSEFTEFMVSDTMSNIWMGILLTGLVLFLFLHDVRSTLIVGLSMPISIISTFVFLRMAGYTINVMTLMGLSTSTGILVANSVVVLENIFRHKDMGNNRVEASDKGTAEIAVAVLASTLTNIVVFLPIATMTSMVGQFFKEFGMTVTFATIFSLITSFTITPMLASMIIPEKKIDTKYGRSFEKYFARFSAWYERLLASLLRTKKTGRLLVLGSVGVLILSLMLVPMIGLELMPSIDQGNITATIELPQGFNLDETAKTVTAIQDKIKSHKEIEHIVTNLGAMGMIDESTNLASCDIKLVDLKKRTRTTQEMISVLRKDLSVIPNAKIKVSQQSRFGGGDPIEFYLQGQDNDKLESLKTEVMNTLRDVPGLTNLDSSTRPGRAELTIIPDREKMAEIGATVYDLALAIRSSVEGMVATKYRESGNEYDIKLSMDDSSVDSPEKLANLPITIFGTPYLLSQLATIDFGAGINKITHQNRFKSIQFTAGNTVGSSMGKVIAEVRSKLDALNLPDGYQITWGGDAQMLSETMVDMVRTFILAVLLTYMLLAAILESFMQPLLIMSTVPMALIGVFVSLFITGFTLNIFSMMAIIMLVGIVVNNAILILDHVNVVRREGKELKESILEAGRLKLKPVIMSTLAIVIGMMPMALGVGSAAKEFRMSMGIVSIGGLIVSTFLTLVLIPVMYYITSKPTKTSIQK